MKAGYKLVLLLGAAGLWAACTEQLAAPTPCDKPCLAGPEVRQDIIAPLNGADSSFVGYILQDHQSTLLISNNLPAGDDRGFVRFLPRPDTVVLTSATDTAVLRYTIDSVALQFNLVARDSMVKGDSLIIYRLDARTDSTITFAQLDAAAQDPARRIGSIVLPDTVKTGTLRMVLDSALADSLLLIPPGDSGRLAVGFSIGADTPTGFVISAAQTTLAPTFVTYATADTTDTLVQKRVILRTGEASGFRVRNPVIPPPDAITVGGIPSSRAIFRFALPKFITDTATIIKAVLYLVPTQPVYGLPNVNARVEARNALADLGRKSPVSTTVIEADSLVFGTMDTVFIPVTTLVRAWGGTIDLPHILVVSLREEGGSFAQPIFGSTRTAGAEPRLVVTYSLPFKFESP